MRTFTRVLGEWLDRFWEKHPSVAFFALMAYGMNVFWLVELVLFDGKPIGTAIIYFLRQMAISTAVIAALHILSIVLKRAINSLSQTFFVKGNVEDSRE